MWKAIQNSASRAVHRFCEQSENCRRRKCRCVNALLLLYWNGIQISVRLQHGVFFLRSVTMTVKTNFGSILAQTSGQCAYPFALDLVEPSWCSADFGTTARPLSKHVTRTAHIKFDLITTHFFHAGMLRRSSRQADCPLLSKIVWMKTFVERFLCTNSNPRDCRTVLGRR
jgi:hypothetical protein